MPPHAHGGVEEEEEEIIVRTDGPPFADIKAKHVSLSRRLSFCLRCLLTESLLSLYHFPHLII